MNDNNQTNLGAVTRAIRIQSELTDEQPEAIRTSPDYLRVKDELYRIYGDVGGRLSETLKPLGIDVVEVQIESMIPRDVRGLYEKLTAVRIVPEAKADAAESRNEFPYWLEGNWCD